MEEFTSELEAITLASSAVSLLIDQFIHQDVSFIQSKPFMQYCLTAVESVGIAALISSLSGKETKGITQDTAEYIKDIIFGTLSSFDKTVHISVLSLVANSIMR